MDSKRGIDIYIRLSGNRTLLNVAVPENLRESFMRSLQDGSFEDSAIPVHIEFTPLPDWATDPEGQARLQSIDLVHMRLALTAINVHFVAEEVI